MLEVAIACEFFDGFLYYLFRTENWLYSPYELTQAKR
jgi:hypothetical protein